MQTALKVLRQGHRTVEKMTPQQFLEAMGVCYTDRLLFSGPLTVHLVRKAFPRMAQWGLVDGGSLLPEEIHSNHSVVWIGESLGYGLMTNRSLRRGDNVGEYTGMVRQAAWSCPAVNAYCVAYPCRWGLPYRFVIDARFWGGLLRYVNHSEEGNLSARWHCHDRIMRLYFVANRDIARCEQLTVHYGDLFWQ